MRQKELKSGQPRIIPVPFGKGKGAAIGKPAVAPPQVPWRRPARNMLVAASYLLLVIVPTLLVALYYLLIAHDQYMVETRFAVRTTSPAQGSSLLEALGIGASGTSATDTYIVREYIHSREILERIDRELNLRERYARPTKDFHAALPRDASFEDFLEYWRSMVTVDMDRTSHILTIRTFAFTPEDSRDIATAILRESERMINELSERARKDAVAYAENEVRKAEERLRSIRQKLLRFRSSTQQIDPAKQAQVQLALIGKLEEQLAQMRAKLSEARSYLSGNAPTIIFLNNRIKALERQIADEKRKLGRKGGAGADAEKRSVVGTRVAGETPSGAPLSATLSEYEALVVEREFAEKFYLSTLSGLEQARLLANRQQRYLATFVRPYLPDEALYPKALRNTIFLFLALTLTWALGLLMIQSIRDRM